MYGQTNSSCVPPKIQSLSDQKIGFSMASLICSKTCSTSLSVVTDKRQFLKFSSSIVIFAFHVSNRFLTTSSSSSFLATSLIPWESTFGGEISMLNSSPVSGSTLRWASFLTLSSHPYSKMQTKLGLMRIDFRRLTWDSVSGKPSKTQPFSLQSLCLILWSISLRRISSGIPTPVSKASCILILMAGFFSASARRIFVGLTQTSPNASATNYA